MEKIKNGYSYVEFANWNRRDQFLLFTQSPYPYIGVTTQVDVGQFVLRCRKNNRRFFNAMLHAVMRALNSVENFRYRMVDGTVFFCDAIDPSFTVFDKESELFYFATAPMRDDFEEFNKGVEAAKKEALETRRLSGDRLDVAYVSCMPWMHFTDVIQPLDLSQDDSTTRILWGKYEQRNDRLEMPLSITAHHGLVDGWHIAKFVDLLQDSLNTDATTVVITKDETK